MKKDEAISILATSQRPREPKDRARYDEAVKMAVDALNKPERKTGHWIPVTNGRGGHQCDKCGCYAPSYQSGTEWLSNFCPECNADMRGEQRLQYGDSDTLQGGLMSAT